MDRFLKEDIKNLIKSSIEHYFSQKREIRKNVLDYIFPVERRVHAVMNGLATSLGTKVWEQLAKFLAKQNGFTISEEKQISKPNPFPPQLKNIIEQLNDERNSGNSSISLLESRNTIREVVLSIDRTLLDFVSPRKGQGVDVYLIKNGREYIFDLKTPHPNRGNGATYNRQLIEWYAHRICQDPSVDIEARIAFTYNPYFPDKTFEEIEGKKIFPLRAGEDFWVCDEFWDFCSGQTNTWMTIQAAFTEIGQDGNFIRKYKKFFY